MASVPAPIPPRAPQLVDSTGAPLRKDLLTQEIAAASLMSARSIITGHPAEGLTPERLGLILRAAEAGDPIAYLELAEAMEEKDLHYLSVLGTRKRQVSQLPISIESASTSRVDERNADLVRAWLRRDTIESDLFDVLDGIGKGFSQSELIWDTSGPEWNIDRIELRDPRWFQFDHVDGRTPLLRGMGLPTPLPAYKFISHLHSAKSGLPIRGGLARPVAWGYLFKNYALKDWIAFAEIFGLPFRIGKYQNGATEADIRTLMRAVAGVGTDAAAVIPASMEIDFVDGKTNGNAALFENLAVYIDKQVSKAVLGQTATTDSEGGGLGGSGKEHNDVRGDIERADAKLLAATLSRDLVRPLVGLNYGPQDAYPRFKIGREEATDLKRFGEFLALMVPLGLRVGEKEVRDRAGLAEPTDEEPILKAPAVPPAVPSVSLSGSDGPDTPASAFLRLLSGPRGASGTVAARAAPGSGGPVAKATDLIDTFTTRSLGDWKPLLDPALAPIAILVGRATTLEEVRDGLAAAASAADPAVMTELLARALFAARLAGLAGASIETN